MIILSNYWVLVILDELFTENDYIIYYTHTHICIYTFIFIYIYIYIYI